MIDLLCNDMLDLKYFKDFREIDKYMMSCLATLYEQFSGKGDPLSVYLLNEIYINSTNLSSLVDENLTYKKLLSFKRKVLNILNENSSKYSKKLKHRILLPEQIDTIR